MAFCKQCGSDMADSTVCSECGYTKKTPSVEGQKAGQKSTTASPPEDAEDNVPDKKLMAAKRPTLKIVFAVIAVAVIIIVVIALFSAKKVNYEDDRYIISGLTIEQTSYSDDKYEIRGSIEDKTTKNIGPHFAHVKLLDKDGNEISETPLVSDINNPHEIWETIDDLDKDDIDRVASFEVSYVI